MTPVDSTPTDATGDTIYIATSERAAVLAYINDGIRVHAVATGPEELKTLAEDVAYKAHDLFVYSYGEPWDGVTVNPQAPPEVEASDPALAAYQSIHHFGSYGERWYGRKPHAPRERLSAPP